MAKFTYGDVVTAFDDLSEAIVKLNESFVFDPGDLKAPHMDVPDYVARCSAWMKTDTMGIPNKLEIVSPEPVELISGATKVAGNVPVLVGSWRDGGSPRAILVESR